MINLRYGVSPQPAHAPLNSNLGYLNCVPLIVVNGRGAFSVTSLNKYSLSSNSSLIRLFLAIISKALTFFLPGQILAHNPQPVQSL